MFDKICSPGLPGTPYLDQAGFKLTKILLLLPSKGLGSKAFSRSQLPCGAVSSHSSADRYGRVLSSPGPLQHFLLSHFDYGLYLDYAAISTYFFVHFQGYCGCSKSHECPYQLAFNGELCVCCRPKPGLLGILSNCFIV